MRRRSRCRSRHPAPRPNTSAGRRIGIRRDVNSRRRFEDACSHRPKRTTGPLSSMPRRPAVAHERMDVRPDAFDGAREHSRRVPGRPTGRRRGRSRTGRGSARSIDRQAIGVRGCWRAGTTPESPSATSCRASTARSTALVTRLPVVATAAALLSKPTRPAQRAAAVRRLRPERTSRRERVVAVRPDR